MLIFPTLITNRTHFNPFPNSGRPHLGKKPSKMHSRGHKKELFQTKPPFYSIQNKTREGAEILLIVLLCGAEEGHPLPGGRLWAKAGHWQHISKQD